MSIISIFFKKKGNFGVILEKINYNNYILIFYKNWINPLMISPYFIFKTIILLFFDIGVVAQSMK